jgi:hypothetical protein
MRKTTMFAATIIIVIVLLAGCGDITRNHFIFLGESEHWRGGLEASTYERFYDKEGSLCYDSIQNEQFSVTYKGELSDLASVKNIEVTCNYPDGEDTISKTYDDGPPDKKTIKSGTGGSEGGTVIKKDDIITMTVTVDGKTETMELKVK